MMILQGIIFAIVILLVVVSVVKRLIFRNKILWWIYRVVTFMFLCVVGLFILGQLAVGEPMGTGSADSTAIYLHQFFVLLVFFVFLGFSFWLLEEP